MAWCSPSVNMVRQPAAVNPGFQGEIPPGFTNAIPNPVPAPTPHLGAYDPKDRTDPLHLHPNESPALQLVTAQLEALGNKIPYQILFNKVPQYQHLRVLGCLAFAVVPTCQRSKFSSRARKCVLLGFANGVKGYKLLDIQTREVFLSRDVCFYENIFPFQCSQEHKPTSLVLPEGMISLDTDEQPSEVLEPVESNAQPVTESITPNLTEESITEEIHAPQPRRSVRTRTTPAYLKDYACHNVAAKKTSPHVISKTLPWLDKCIDLTCPPYLPSTCSLISLLPRTLCTLHPITSYLILNNLADSSVTGASRGARPVMSPGPFVASYHLHHPVDSSAAVHQGALDPTDRS
nr:uncharacterized protein LOC109147102 [Ipomoea trifida]